MSTIVTPTNGAIPTTFSRCLCPLPFPAFSMSTVCLLSKSQLTPKSIQVLDLGCGGGLVAEEMARLGYCVTGIDPSERSIAVARTHAHDAGLAIDYRSGAGDSIPFEDTTFDAA